MNLEEINALVRRVQAQGPSLCQVCGQFEAEHFALTKDDLLYVCFGCYEPIIGGIFDGD
jgi:hypothetical protein